MCGIVGYLGKRNAVSSVLSGLEALEYRGYDSAGVAFFDKNKFKVVKQTGRVKGLDDALRRQNDTLFKK